MSFRVMAFLWEKLGRRVMFGLDAETAHEVGMKALRSGLAAPFYADPSSFGLGPVERFGLKFPNPIGIAAGFDKNAVAVNQLASLGFGFVEIGTVTYHPQSGNPKPRMFRLPEDFALINRLGFNNEGAVAVAKRLSRLDRKCVIGVNIGKNKDVPNEEATENYLASFELLQRYADYVAVNISSPNTPNLRELQRSENLDELLAALQKRNQEMADSGGNAGMNSRRYLAGEATTGSTSGNGFGLAADLPPPIRPEGRTAPPLEGGEFFAVAGRPNATLSRVHRDRVSAGKTPLLVKIAPDLTEGEIEAAVDICIKHEIAGIIATNTTIGREGLRTKTVEQIEAGGLSGRPLTSKATEVISTIFRYSKGRLPIIGVGGILTAKDAFDKIAAGASLVQAYTGFVYGGPTFAGEVNVGLAAIIRERGFASVDEAVGSGVAGV